MMIKTFLDHLRVSKNASSHTLSAYERDLKQFEEVIKKRSTLIKATESDIQYFLKDLKKRDQKTSSIARKISALKQFYKFLIQENLISEDPSLFIEAPAPAKKLPKSLDPSMIEKLLKAVDEGLDYGKPSPLTEALQLRDRTMIYFLYATGVRVSELISVEVKNVDLLNSIAKVLGKRRKERMVPFAPIVNDLLQNYLEKARPVLGSNDTTLFLGKGGEPLTRQGFWKVLKKLATKAGLSTNLHPHLLRHTFATDLLKSGMDLRSLQMLLGHADLQTTQIYTHVAPDHLQDVIRKYHPRGGK